MAVKSLISNSDNKSKI